MKKKFMRNKNTKKKPAVLEPVGSYFSHFKNILILKIDFERLPLPNQSIFLNRTVEVGKADEIFGTRDETYLSVKMSRRLKELEGEYFCGKNILKEKIVN